MPEKRSLTVKRGPMGFFQVVPSAYCDSMSQSEFSNKKISTNLMVDAVIGMIVGFGVGAMVSFSEELKINRQTYGSKSFSAAALQKHIFSVPKETVFSFATAFAGVCAIELSIIEGMKKWAKSQYGEENKSEIEVASAFVAGVSGALWLTPADHILYRNVKYNQKPLLAINYLWNIHPKVLWAGYTPMVAREFIFSLTHFLLAEDFGRYLYNCMHPNHLLSGNDSIPEKSKHYQTAGNMILGIPAALFTQPADSLTRFMQMQAARGEPSNFKNAISYSMKENGVKTFFDGVKVVYRGTAARALLATVGGTSVKLFYGNLKETIEGNDHKKSYVQPRIG
ncbi:MAG: hypothetical protein KBD83_02485 [Gammaproteobacteria bacterium]|nr:hypothetical protein [Gammaproteobacteria bacterium]